MRTTHSLTVSRSIRGREHTSQGVCMPGCVCVPGVCVYLRGMSFWGVMHALGAPWTEFLIHACENITFLQLLLWVVNIRYSIVQSVEHQPVQSHYVSSGTTDPGFKPLKQVLHQM